jgi:hypothetical protein
MKTSHYPADGCVGGVYLVEKLVDEKAALPEIV